jgi:formiminoglutamase
MTKWLHVERGEAPLVIAIPHTGALIPTEIEERFVSPWLARVDTDWWMELLYDFAPTMSATMVRTEISRAVIDVNRDPSGASLYPGQATTELCPTTTFDGVPLYREGMAPDDNEIARRRATWFAPYHEHLQAEIDRLRRTYKHIVVYDAHSIRSHIPRLFDGELPTFNVGTNNGATCDAALRDAISRIVATSGEPHVVDGRFRGGWTTRHYGRPETGVHAVQMELAQRGYMQEPDALGAANWPTSYDPSRATRTRETLKAVLSACLDFAQGQEEPS